MEETPHDVYISHRIHVCYIYGNIYHQCTPNVSIYTIHGSYGYIQISRSEIMIICKSMICIYIYILRTIIKYHQYIQIYWYMLLWDMGVNMFN